MLTIITVIINTSLWTQFGDHIKQLSLLSSVMDDNRFAIQLISHNMRREEMMAQVIISLDQLSTITDHIFKRIDEKIESMNEKLLDINQRRQNCVNKIQQIKQLANKATKIYANYKYPMEELSSVNDIYRPISGQFVDTNLINSFYEDIKISAKHIPFDEQLIKEKTQFFSIPKTYHKSIDDFDSYDLNLTEPLGPIPWHRITSLSSLLVFNTADNPYLRRSQGSSLYDQKIRSKRPQDANVQNNDIFEAPDSILHSEQTEIQDPLLYLPKVQSAPQIMDDLPAALPALAGIADDIIFTQMDEDFMSSTIPNLKSINQIKPQLPEITNIDEPNIKTVSQNIVNVTQPKTIISQTIAQSTTTIPTAVPPPPPFVPPPPPPPPTLPSITKGVSTTSVQMSNDNSRSNLLASIREAAGKPKKNVMERKKEAKKAKQKEVVSGDLMTDLFNKLAMRRKGISGTNVAKESNSVLMPSGLSADPNSAMQRISSMIPPPPPPIPSVSQEDNEDDWD
ncbi:WASH complex subunit 1-like [Oppia nitens]|uniref:WASH complex subunit 1-like n=1 Tax=Oppia nitens TaxID=1686743 RepID=UPI0023DAC689|nr:WASH complex subunit 1-like [Oppia nitens]